MVNRRFQDDFDDKITATKVYFGVFIYLAIGIVVSFISTGFDYIAVLNFVFGVIACLAGFTIIVIQVEKVITVYEDKVARKMMMGYFVRMLIYSFAILVSLYFDNFYFVATLFGLLSVKFSIYGLDVYSKLRKKR